MKWRMEQTLCRNLILNIYQTIQEITPVGRVIIPFKAIYEALRLAGVAGVGGSGGNNSNNNAVMFETLDDVECLLVGLIDEVKYVKKVSSFLIPKSNA